MAAFVVQGFEKRRGVVVPTAKEAAPSESAAVKRAEAWSGRMSGAAALAIVVDNETGAVQSAKVLATFGTIPEDFVDGLTGG